MRRRLYTCLLLPLFALIMLSSTSAFTEERVDVEATITLNLMTTSTTSSTAGFFVFWTFFEIATSSTDIGDGISSTTSRTLAPLVVTEQFLTHNAVALQQDISVGGGQAVRDLARICSIPTEHTADFGKMLQKNRKQLIPMLNQEIDRTRTLAFLDLLEGKMKAHKTLSVTLASR